MGRSGKVVFAQNNSHFRVRCDLSFKDKNQALALSRIIESFTASVERLEGKVERSIIDDSKRRPVAAAGSR